MLTSLLAIIILIAACSPAAPGTTAAPAEGERLRVVASLSPIKNIVYNIGGDRIDLVGILPPGVDPHTFEPKPSDAVKVAEADLIFLNGIHLDETTLKLAEANLKEGAEIIELAAAVAGPDELIYGIEHHHGHAEEEGHDDDDDEHGHDEEEGEPDPHLLLDPNFVIRYAKVVFVTLSAHDPDNRDYYEANFNEYTARLLALDEAIQATTATIPESNRRLLTYHDSFGYFAIRYGYTVIGAIQPNDTSQPSAQEVAALIVQLLDEDVPAIFGSALFPADVLEQIASATGASVRTLRDEDLPGAPGDPEHTYIGMMVENLRTLAESLGGDSSLMDGVDVGNVPDSE
ncbi:MAG: zinc ABC transporter substrate-binding protein [Caldilineaceae bacterium SB0670_bin_27]|nr:zinc ABC transporter substrate-binding protein [Caldilineaceae bacterium SB0670_bin_27]